ncbi:hypothetical protein DFH06DRAFT_1380620 [Mycena polygramma]|nr:hypothetical protein DFH06DRAFT_1380620 [Mycena polygramma]
MLKTSTQVAARTLGYAILYAPSAEGRLCVSNEILACERDLEILAGLAHLYIFGLIRVFKNPKGATPFVSLDGSPPIKVAADLHDSLVPAEQSLTQLKDEVGVSLNVAADLSHETLVPAGKTPKQLKDEVMHREWRRCALSGTADLASIDADPIHPDVDDIPDSLRSRAEPLQVAHIISQSLTNGITGMTEKATLKLDWASSAAAILDRFAGLEIKALLGDLDLHNPLNALLMSHVPHYLFDSLWISLEGAHDAQGNMLANEYDVISYKRYRHYTLLDRTTFANRVLDGVQSVPPPSPVLLGLHAACVRIAHMSGAAEVLKIYDREVEPLSVLSMGTNNEYNTLAAKELERALHVLSFSSPVYP